MDFDLPSVSPVPAHSPYQAGEWVRCHGYPGEPYGPRRWGFRGYVLGTLGDKILCGVTDDGRPWSETWGALEPDRSNQEAVVRCTCCPRWHKPKTRKTTTRPKRRAPTGDGSTPAELYAHHPGQLELFETGQG